MAARVCDNLNGEALNEVNCTRLTLNSIVKE